jgi:hypothetical protein
MGALVVILAILLVLLLAVVLGSGKRGYGPAGLIGVVALILFIVLFFGYA